MTKLCIDFGSGYNPKAGYKTCDITTFPQLDFQYDGKDEIVGLREKSVDVFYLRNVVHHIPDLQRTFTTLKKYLKVDSDDDIIEALMKGADKYFYPYCCSNEHIEHTNSTAHKVK